MPPKPIRVVTGCFLGVILFVILLILLQASSEADHPGRNLLIRAGEERELPGKTSLPVQANDRMNRTSSVLRWSPANADPLPACQNGQLAI